MSTQIVKKNSAGALASINLRQYAGKGTEEIGSDDVSTPILKILHQLSPECNTRSPKHVEGAQPGMIYSANLGTLIDGDKGLDIVVAHSHQRWPEWQDKGEGSSAPVNVHMSIPNDAVEEIRGIKYRLSNGNYVEKTFYFYVITMVDELPRKAVITMRSSNLTPARDLNNQLKNLKTQDAKGTFQAPSFMGLFKLKTAAKNSGDKSWHVYKPAFVRMLDLSNDDESALFKMGADFQDQVSKGSAKPKYEKVAQSEDIA
tara:strand:+ start:457 stop:1230 length:774 start_codon:yes stop_codon:yes gene_type:complete